MIVFLSYATTDYFFAELAEIKLAEAGIKLWRDKGSLSAGTDWRQGIENGISNCRAVLIALSPTSAESPYVTYEWAYAIGKGKTVIPIKISKCEIHPRLGTIQYLDFTLPNSLPWDLLIERIKEIETDNEQNILQSEKLTPISDKSSVNAILNYLNQRGYQMASFERLRKRVDTELTDEKLNALIDRNNTVFRRATLKGNEKGIAKIIP